MKIKVTLTVDVDPAAWADEYGTRLSEVREDVKRHAANSLLAHFESVGVLVR